MRTIKQLLKTIFKYRLSSGLTILSLVVAFLGIIILSLYVSYERSFDNFHPHGNDIYRMSFRGDAFLPIPIKKLAEDNVPEIENALAVRGTYDIALSLPGKNKQEAVSAQMFVADRAFFSMLNFPLTLGQVDHVLAEPNTVVVSETLAKKLFGTTDIVGKSVMLENDNPFVVSGVMRDMPGNSIFKCDVVLSLATYTQFGGQDWGEWAYSLFFQLKEGANKQVVIDKISTLGQLPEYIKKAQESSSSNTPVVQLQALRSLHFDTKNFLSIDERLLNVLTLLIVILLLMGAVNFVNYVSSQAPLRAKSLSVQQILGASKWHARWQIIGEAIALSLFALGLALFIHHYIYQYLETLFQIDGLSMHHRPSFYAIFVVLSILFGVVAGIYPAFYITSAPVSQAVKGKMLFSGQGKRFRNVLISIQFVFSIALIASVFTIEKQLYFWNHFDMGVNKDNVLYMEMTPALIASQQAFTDELMKNPEITDYTYSQSILGGVGMGWSQDINGKHVEMKTWPVDERFLDFFDIKIVEGRKFGKGKADINTFIFNETAVRQLGWDKPLEKTFKGFGLEGDIVGVSQDFNFSSLKREIEPMLFWLTDADKYVVMLRATSANYTRVRQFVAATAHTLDPENTFEVKFLDNYLESLYAQETRIAHFIEFVALWAILLAITGLLGLVIFMSRDRVKEIGIRKINGASIWEIIRLLNKGVLIWLSIAFVIATPIAYYAMNKWLENFAYKTALNWWIFALAGLSALAIALLTVSWQSYRAASRNPVEALRYE